MTGKEWVRPYWHVDLKWVFGIFFTFFLFVSLIAFLLFRLTSEKIAIPLATYMIASQFSRNGLDDQKDIEELKRKNLQSGNVIHPLPGQNVSVTKQELNELSPRELRFRIFEQIVTPVYKQQRTEKTMKEFGFLAFLNYETHDFLNKIFLISLIPLFLTGFGLIIFSYRYGRFVSLSVPLLLISTIPSIVLFLMQKTALKDSNNGLFSIPKEVILELISSLSQVFYMILGVGVILFLVGVIAGNIFKEKMND